MVLKVSHKELNLLIREHYNKKTSLFVYGAFGIGKSFVVRDSAEEIAKSKKREFVQWNKISKEEKQEVFNNPEKYFVIIDERLSEYDSSDIKGLPNFKNGEEIIEWKVPFWAKFITKKDSEGIIFFDEINLAPPLVISSVYKIIYDRIIGDTKISDGWSTIGAGNREEDMAFTHTLPAPVRDRGSEVELTTSNVDEFTDWGSRNNLDSRIIGYVNASRSSLYKVDFEDNQKFTTPRGWERLSNLIKEVEDNETLDLLSSSAIGEGIAKQFVAFCKISQKLNIDDIVKNPQKIKEHKEPDRLYFVVTAVADRYKDEKLDFKKLIEISNVLDEMEKAEFTVLIWRLSKNYAKERFNKDFQESKDKILEKYAKYLT